MIAKKSIFYNAAAALFLAVAAMALPGCPGGASSSAPKPVENQQQAPERADVSIMNSQNVSLKVAAELALTDEQRATGLMNRTSMAENDGMLFVFPDSQRRSFWMKNTLIPLDMIFISETGLIVDINRNAQPGNLTPYTSSSPAKYVLEVNGGWCDAKQVQNGNLATIPNLN